MFRKESITSEKNPTTVNQEYPLYSRIFPPDASQAGLCSSPQLFLESKCVQNQTRTNQFTTFRQITEMSQNYI